MNFGMYMIKNMTTHSCDKNTLESSIKKAPVKAFSTGPALCQTTHQFKPGL